VALSVPKPLITLLIFVGHSHRFRIGEEVCNLEGQPGHAPWLQTATDRVHPDFVCRLKDGDTSRRSTRGLTGTLTWTRGRRGWLENFGNAEAKGVAFSW
jgi:hypothetical protein